MAAIKSYTDLEQSKKLAEILPLESADYCWGIDYESRYLDLNDFPYTEPYNTFNNKEDFIPCWSLAALFGVLPLINFTRPLLIGTPKTLYKCMYNDDLKSHAYDNPIDACIAMVEKLKELKML